MIIFDAEKHASTEEQTVITGAMGFISYDRLIRMFAETGEVTATERLTHLVMDRRGIQFKVERK